MRVGGLARGSLIIGLLGAAALGLLWSSGSNASAGGVADVTIAVGDVWFCAPEFQGELCETEVTVGDKVLWDFSPAEEGHTTTECGADCSNPTETPLWDSGFVLGESFQFTFDTPGVYNYICSIHPFAQKGRIIVSGAPTNAGDANCSGSVNAIDAAIVLQFDAGLLGAIPCADNADVNQNGTVNTIDAALILQYDAGLLGQLPP